MSSQVVSLSPAWTIPGYFQVANGHLTIDGADALSLISEYGSPLFVFSAPRIRSNIERLKLAAQAVERPIRFCYASKANSNMAVLKTVQESGIDVEVNSGGELFKALRVGFRPDQIIFNGTSKSDEELDEAVRAGIYAINVDSIYEIGLVEESVRRVSAERREAVKPGTHNAAPGPRDRNAVAPGTANSSAHIKVRHFILGSARRFSARPAKPGSNSRLRDPYPRRIANAGRRAFCRGFPQHVGTPANHKSRDRSHA